MADAALRIYAEDHPALSHRLRAKLAARATELAGQVSGGYALDWPDYKERVGIIKGLIEAVQLCEADEKLLNGER